MESRGLFVEDFTHPKEYIQLMDIYSDYVIHHKVYEEAAAKNNVELFNKKHRELFILLYKMIDHINIHRDILQKFKHDKFFGEVCDLLYDAKNRLSHNDTILNFRKCINWIRRKW
jgi:hypothetical protein